jgi:DNA-binding NarL/FixJ family response regulator
VKKGKMETDKRVVVLARHRAVREGISKLLVAADVEVVEEAESLDEVAVGVKADVFVAHESPDEDPAAFLARLRAAAGGAGIVLLLDENRLDADGTDLGRGLSGVFVENVSAGELISLIAGAVRGEVVVLSERSVPQLQQQQLPIPPDPFHVLTPRERQVLTVLSSGKTAAQTATVLSISVQTVQSHVRSILVKLGARSTVEAVIIALREGLLTLRGA